MENTELLKKALFVESSKSSTVNDTEKKDISNYTNDYQKDNYYKGKGNFNKNVRNSNKNYSSNNNNKFGGNNNSFNQGGFNTKNRNDRNSKPEESDYSDLKKPVFTNSKLGQQRNESGENNNINKEENNKKDERSNNLNITKNYEATCSSQIKSESNVRLSINSNTNITITNSNYNKNKDNNNENLNENSESISLNQNTKKKDLHIQDLLNKEPNQINDDIQNCQKSEMEKVIRNINFNYPQQTNQINSNIANINFNQNQNNKINNNPNQVLTQPTNIVPQNPPFSEMFPNNINNINNISNLQNIQINNLTNLPTPIKGIPQIPMQIPTQPNIIIPGMSPVVPTVGVNPMVGFNIPNQPMGNFHNIAAGNQNQFYKKFNQFPQQQINQMNQMNQMNYPHTHIPPFSQHNQMYQYSNPINFGVDFNQFHQQQYKGNTIPNQIISQQAEIGNSNLNFNLNENNNNNFNNIDYTVQNGFYNSSNQTNNSVQMISGGDDSVNTSIVMDINSTTRKLNIKAKDFVPKKKFV